MSSNFKAPAQHKQSSRKGKKAWRKNIDVTEVESGLESVREEITHGGVISEKPAEDLFSVDGKGSDTIRSSYAKSHKPTKVNEILARRSAIPALESHKRSRTTDGVLEPSSKKRKNNAVSHRELERLRVFANSAGSVAQKAVSSNESPVYDLWGHPSNNDEALGHSAFLEKPKPVKAPETLKHAPTSLLTASKPLSAVPRPRPATSYNPLFEAWDRDLTRLGSREVEAEKRRLQETVLEEQRQERVAAVERDGTEYLTEEESAWEGFESEREEGNFLVGPRPGRKTRAERNKIKKRKQEERRQRAEAKEKQKRQQACEIRTIINKVKLEARTKVLTISRDESTMPEEADEAEIRRRRFGKHKLPEQPLQIVLPDELQDSLRRLKPEGNLLNERFRNVQIRGLVETRKGIQQPKKARRTHTEKWQFKDLIVPVW